MFSDGYLTWLVCRRDIRDRLREAERDRLVRRVLAGHRTGDRFLVRALAWLGRYLVAWGQRLQERYGVVVDSPALRAANRAVPEQHSPRVITPLTWYYHGNKAIPVIMSSDMQNFKLIFISRI